MPNPMHRNNLGRILKRMAMMGAAVAVGFCLVMTGCLLAVQRTMVYPGARYEPSWRRVLPEGLEVLEYSTPEGAQISFYQPRSDGNSAPPARLWVCFHGNASTALDWLDFLHRYPAGDEAFLLVDFPGYGANEGKPSPAAITEAADAALATLLERRGWTEADLEGRLAVLGFSIGGGAALHWARHRPVSGVVVVSTFMSLREMAGRAVGPFRFVLMYHYDNDVVVRELLSRPNPPRIAVVHGGADDIVPTDQGRRLAAIDPAIHWVELPGHDHNTVLYSGQRAVWDAMAWTRMDKE